jgi:hypothetical protein
MKCSECVFCIGASTETHQRTNANFQCDNKDSNAYTLEIFNPENAGCDAGIDKYSKGEVFLSCLKSITNNQ